MKQLIILDKIKDKELINALKKWIGNTSQAGRTEEAKLTGKENVLIEELYNIL